MNYELGNTIKPFFHKVLKALPKKKYSLFIKKNEA